MRKHKKVNLCRQLEYIQKMAGKQIRRINELCIDEKALDDNDIVLKAVIEAIRKLKFTKGKERPKQQLRKWKPFND